jgi:hypothetical protein
VIFTAIVGEKISLCMVATFKNSPKNQDCFLFCWGLFVLFLYTITQDLEIKKIKSQLPE